MDLKEMYNYYFVELSDPHTREWLLISTSYPILLIILGYIYFIFYAGPRYMKDRLPYKLKTFILIYNIFQILANLWIVKEHISAGWILKQRSLICNARHGFELNAIKLFDTSWWLFLLKILDLVETCVFVLRKKQNQVSILHAYHHISVLIFVWHYLKYVLDERITFLLLYNCSIHVIMYMYYLLAAWSPNFQQKISFIKPFITKMQMIQFIVMLIYVLQILNPECEVDTARKMSPLFIGNLFIYLYLFYNFYKKNYTSKQKDN